ncbi:DUF6132 family protein [Oscillatoria amoena NRMC-F 0135]|nr:DUF6132 family protein [Oscillatoria amoena NRMC-F 0135]
MIQRFLIRNKVSLAGLALGAGAGWLYWNQIGCATGTCTITSTPFNSTVYGALVGWLLFSSFKKEPEKNS